MRGTGLSGAIVVLRVLCLQVSSVVSRANGQRTYAFNGQKLPKHRFALAFSRPLETLRDNMS